MPLCHGDLVSELSLIDRIDTVLAYESGIMRSH